jgi:hypothetical protein
MKRVFSPLLCGLALLCYTGVKAQEFREHITKEFPVTAAKPGVLAIYNLNGPVKVEGYAGDKVVVEIDKVITADDSTDLQTGKREFKMGIDQNADTIMFYIEEPYDTRPHRRWRDDGWGTRRPEYEFQLSFIIKVPYAMNVVASTVNRGDIVVQDVAGTLDLNNVNGPITIRNAKGATKVRTINGDVTVNYLDVPQTASDYYTLNGELSVTYPASMSAVCQFKSMNGSFYTNFSDVVILPAQVIKNREQTGNGVMYKLNVARQIKIGSGGQLFKFETMNGDIYVKKQS